ncbi:LHFPL tetraspan subfamily member 3 protein [Anthonomus grandis grandis]|uniref:LHFPL tetraspan subfamily member 3 protein n=1 Tax=Anthonomus grandis grandis TaxID=2921223 RepID=UPI002165D6FA|nr:LHFPL tetraspan subfamily member 3 protein [Anthonomus grandis grandis]
MGSKIEYVDSSQIYAANYVRNAKAIGVLWAIFTICYAIVIVVAFITPEWIGNVHGETPGKFGLWSVCYAEENGEICKGRLDDLMNMPNRAFQFATTLVGIAVITSILAICSMMLFFFCHSTTVFHVCGWIQLISGAAMIAGCALYPYGWAQDDVIKVCGPTTDEYQFGDCSIRWAYILAAIGCLDAITLATLAFILATRHVTLQAEPNYTPASLYKGEMNSSFMNDSASIAGSRKSLNMHPVLLMPPGGQDDTYSQFSQRTVPRSVHSGHYAHPHSLHRNFQL